MKVYLVGGAVRDQLMGIVPKDRDWVVVGATIEEMRKLGYRQVGLDFPTFLHPVTHEEYSLARKERQGGVATFSPDVTLEEDLAKRDLTINAIAYDPDTNEYIDPFNGRKDIERKILCRVSEEAFAEDPLRVFRIARFAARYPDFKVSGETMMQMWRMSIHNKLVGIKPERIWKEVSRGLMEKKPSRMLHILRVSQALHAWLPEVDKLYGVVQPEQHHPEICTGKHTELAVDVAADMGFDLATRTAVLFHDLGKALTPKEELPSHHGHEAAGVPLVEEICERLRIPNDIKEVAVIATREHLIIHKSMDIRVSTLVRMFQRNDGYRRPKRLIDAINAAECDARGREGKGVSYRDRAYPQAAYTKTLLAAAGSVVAGIIAMKYFDRPKNKQKIEHLQDAIHASRVSAAKKAVRALKDKQDESRSSMLPE